MLKNSFRGVSVAFRRTALGLAAVVTMGATLAQPAPSAQAMPAVQIPNLSSEAEKLAQDFNLEQVFKTTRENAWLSRNAFLQQVKDVNPQVAETLEPIVDGMLEGVFPGLKAEKMEQERIERERQAQQRAEQAAQERRLAEEAAARAEQERQRNQFDSGPCPADARVCVDIDGRRTWLQKGGKVDFIAPSMAPGRNTPKDRTPRGTFTVSRKVKDEVSYEFNNAPMPYAVYFTNNGHAFHMGDPAYESAGCIRLPQNAAQKYFNDLQIGDKVFIY